MRAATLCRLALTASLFAAFLGSSAASAVTTGFDLMIDGSYGQQPGTVNVPLVTLTNRSSEALLTSFSLTIGDPAFNFDGVIQIRGPAGGSSRLMIGDTNIPRVDGVNTDTIALAFTGFKPGESVSFGVDIDADNGNFFQDYRNVLFNNGAAPNAQVTVQFTDAAPLVLTLNDVSDPGPITRASALSTVAADTVSAIPVPASAFLLGAALLCASFLRRRPGS